MLGLIAYCIALSACLAFIPSPSVAATSDHESVAVGASGPAAESSPADPPLDAITVKSKKLFVQTRLVDRKVYTTAADVQSTFGTLGDVLNDIPSVDVSPDGTVSLRGSTDVLILVNGKPSAQFSGASAGDAIQSFPAKDIERIEVFTTPPPEFQADGTAGVINIVTRKPRDRGVTGSVQASIGNGARTVENAIVDYRSDDLTVSTTIGYRRIRKDRELQSTLEVPDSNAPGTSESVASGGETIFRTVPTLRLSADYTVSDRQSISGSLFWSERPSHRSQQQSSATYDPSGLLVRSAQTVIARRDSVSGWEESLSFTQKLGRPDESLVIGLNHSAWPHHETYDYRTLLSSPLALSTTPPAAVAPAQTGLASTFGLNSLERYGETDVSADYTLPFSKVRSLKVGYAFEQDDYNFNAAGDKVDTATGELEADPSLTDRFRHRLRVQALYATYQDAIGHWTWLGGFRAELAQSKMLQFAQPGLSSAYGKVFPSLNISYKLSDQTTLSLGATSRLARPDPEQLNPFIHREYAPNLEAGNATLKPQFTDSYEGAYSFDGERITASLTGYYRVNRGSMSQVVQPTADGETLATQANLARTGDGGLEISITGHVVAKIDYSLTGDLFHQQIDATGLGESGLRSNEGANGKIKLQFHPTSIVTAQLSVVHKSKALTPQGYVGATNIVNVGYEHHLSTHLTAVATVSDLFDGQRFRRWAVTPTFTDEYRITTKGQIAYVGFVYAFGEKKQGPSDPEYEK